MPPWNGWQRGPDLGPLLDENAGGKYHQIDVEERTVAAMPPQNAGDACEEYEIGIDRQKRPPTPPGPDHANEAEQEHRPVRQCGDHVGFPVMPRAGENAEGREVFADRADREATGSATI